MKKALIVSFFVCLAIFLAHYFVVGSAVYGDGKYYYSITRSIVIDHNIDFANEYEVLDIFEKSTTPGSAGNKYPPGVSIIWLVPFLLAHMLSSIISFFVPVFMDDGYTFWYQFLTGAYGILLSIWGIYLLYLTLIRFYSEKVSRFTSLTVLFATNIFFYASYDVINSHAASFFAAVLILFLSLYKQISRPVNWFIVGLAAGLATLIRTLDSLLLIVCIYLLFRNIKKFGDQVKSLAILIVGFLLVYGIQAVNNYLLFGRLDSPYLTGSEGFSFLSPHLVGVLFNSDTGLVWWTPLVAMMILALLFEKRYSFTKFFFLLIVLQIYVIASWSSWDQGGSFGVRMMIGTLPLASFGLAKIYVVIEKFYKRWGLYFTWGITTLVNQILIVTYLLNH